MSQDLRLTLSVLLAYRESVLGPADMEDIGRKIGDSVFAQELNERIDTITKAHLDHSEIASGAQVLAPNDIAEYIDGILKSASVTEFELLCLQNDPALAEVATCYQILASFLRMEGKPESLPPVRLGTRIKKVLTDYFEAKEKSEATPRDNVKPTR